VAAQQEESDAREASARRRAEIQAEHPWLGVDLVDLLECFAPKAQTSRGEGFALDER
jgi:hypothetical protein